MKMWKSSALAAAAVGLLVSAPALAAGPLDGEVDALWWGNDFEAHGVSEEAGAPGFRASLWFQERYGVRAGQFSSETDDFGSDTAEYTAVDVLWRAFAPAEHNYVAVGLGWQQMDLAALGLEGSTSGMRVSVEGHLGLIGIMRAYGQGAYMPSLDDTPATFGGDFQDMEAMEYELGLAFKVAPFMSVKAGWRSHALDYTLPAFEGSPTDAPDGAQTYTSGSGSPGFPVDLNQITTTAIGCGGCATAIVTEGANSADSTGYFVGVGLTF